MRKFFSFRSSSVSSRRDHPPPLCPNQKNMYSETPWMNIAEKIASAEILESSRTNEVSASSDHQRSGSFSSPACYSNGEEGNNFLSDLSGPISKHSGTLDQNARVQVDYLSQAPHRFFKSKMNSESAIFETDTSKKPNLSKNHHCSAQNSTYISPVLSRCKSYCETQMSDINKAVDAYIDQEKQQTTSDQDCQQPSCTGNYCCQAENRMIPSLGYPPRSLHTAPASPNYSKENMRSSSLTNEKGAHHHVFIQDHARGDLQPLTPQKYVRKIIWTLDHVFSGKPKVKLQDYDSETTTTIEDIYEDSSDLHYSFKPNSPRQGHARPLLDLKPVPVYDTTDIHCREDAQFLERQTCFGEADLTSSKLDSSICLEKHADKIDRELLRKLEETEERITLIPEMDHDIEKPQNGDLCASSLEHMLRNIIQDRKNLELELSFQLRSRIAERSSMEEALVQAKTDLDTRTKMLEKENNELQSYVDNELDRRSCDWLLKLEKLEAEEHRLRTCMREVAEQNISLQRQVSFLNGREMEARSRMLESELQFNSLTERLEEARDENERLNQVLSELQGHYDGAKADRDCIVKAYKEKEKENKELQKTVVRLQRICTEQVKTINGLRQGFSDEIMKQSSDNCDPVSKLQNEQIRLTGVEQKLRREVESYRFEVESLRHENIHLLERLQGVGNRCGISLLRLDQELHARIDCLKNQGLSLLDDSSELCAKLLELVKYKQCGNGQEVAEKLNSYSVVEYSMKFHNLREAVKILRRSLQMVSIILDEKSTTGASEHLLQITDSDLSRQLNSVAPVDEMEYELRMQILLNRVLQEKLCYKELDLEQLQAELASSVGSNEILKSEIQRVQDNLSCLRHKMNEMELQMLKKDDNLNQLHFDLQGCMRELTTVRGILPKISEERDHLWEEVKQLQEINMLLEREVKSLNKKVEALDEDILIKEGQITMLKDSLRDNPFATEFSWE